VAAFCKQKPVALLGPPVPCSQRLHRLRTWRLLSDSQERVMHSQTADNLTGDAAGCLLSCTFKDKMPELHVGVSTLRSLTCLAQADIEAYGRNTSRTRRPLSSWWTAPTSYACETLVLSMLVHRQRWSTSSCQAQISLAANALQSGSSK